MYDNIPNLEELFTPRYERFAEMVGFGLGRTLLSEPGWVNNVRSRQFDSIRPYEGQLQGTCLLDVQSTLRATSRRA